MKRPNLWIFLFVLMLAFGCGPEPEEDSTSEAPVPERVETSPEDIPRQFPTDRPIYRVETPYSFSNPNTFDQFQLLLQGSTITEGEVTFTIRLGTGEEVHREVFPAAWLLDPGFQETYPQATVRMQEAYIIQRMREFFVEGNFTQPAVRPQDTFDPSSSDRSVWDEIKEDPSAVSFYYLVGNGPAKELAWSKQQQKVVVLKQ